MEPGFQLKCDEELLCRPPPRRPGTYVLIIDVKQYIAVRYTRRGDVAILKPGLYAYVGSAFGTGGLHARVARHLSSWKRPHWHIDRLLVLEGCVEPVCVVYCIGAKLERYLASVFSILYTPIPGFGASDDRVNSSHLFRIGNATSSQACWLIYSHMLSRCKDVGVVCARE